MTEPHAPNLAAVRDAFAVAHQAQADALASASALRRQAVLQAQASGMTSREIGAVLGLTHSRVLQIAAGRRK